MRHPYLDMIYFGQFVAYSRSLTDWTASNAKGKTTLLNAYLFALTGRCAAGFEPRTITAPPDLLTSVTLCELFDGIVIRRTLSAGGKTTLCVNDETFTQTEFVEAMASRGYNIDLYAACADANVLTDPSLTSEQLRRLLTRAGVMSGDDADAIRREIKGLREERRAAEAYAVTTISVPVSTCEPPTQAELEYLERWDDAQHVVGQAQHVVGQAFKHICIYCGQSLPEHVLEEKREKYAAALDFTERARPEVSRIRAKREKYEEEQSQIRIADAIITRAIDARKKVQDLNAKIAQLEAQLQALDADAVEGTLPVGVEIVTSKTAKTSGKTSNVCTLTYNGVPLKSINRGKRIELCVRILDEARTQAGMRGKIPIIIDNAEAVQGLDDVPNVIRLSVG